MPTQQEEQQVKEFLSRTEIRTMRKDLLALRENDALKERDKIAAIKTVEEQLQEQRQKLAAQETAQSQADKAGRQQIIASQDDAAIEAGRSLKQYATETERQQIFLLESKKLNLEKQVENIQQNQEPELRLKKNALLLELKKYQDSLRQIQAQEHALENEEKAIVERSQVTTVPSEKKTLEQSKWDLDKKIQDVEKQRWAQEKQIADAEQGAATIDQQLSQLETQANGLRMEAAGIEKSLRQVYSVIIDREEDRKRGALKEQQDQRDRQAQEKAKRNETVRRAQRNETSSVPGALKAAPQSLRERLEQGAKAEEEARKKFLQNVSQAAETGGGQQVEKSNIT